MTRHAKPCPCCRREFVELPQQPADPRLAGCCAFCVMVTNGQNADDLLVLAAWLARRGAFEAAGRWIARAALVCEPWHVLRGGAE